MCSQDKLMLQKFRLLIGTQAMDILIRVLETDRSVKAEVLLSIFV